MFEFTHFPLTFTDRCKCGAVDRLVLHVMATGVPGRTAVLTGTRILERWQ